MKKVLFLLLLMIIPACGMECLASIKLNLNQCVRQGDNVVMNFVIQNDGDKDVSFDLGSDSFNPSIVYDLQGCQYKATCLQQGNNSGTINLPSDIHNQAQRGRLRCAAERERICCRGCLFSFRVKRRLFGLETNRK